jgi:ribosome recycling factor
MLEGLLKELKEEFQKTEDWFKRETMALRGSRLSIEIFDNIKVDCYNNKMSLKEVATLSLVDSRTISIEPWDKSLIPSIEKCLSQVEIQGSLKNDGKRLLFSIPVIAQEDREKIVKILKQKMEQARQTLRRIRDEYWSKIQEMERKGEIPEDEKFKSKEEIQKIIEQSEKQLEKIEENKEKEIMS